MIIHDFNAFEEDCKKRCVLGVVNTCPLLLLFARIGHKDTPETATIKRIMLYRGECKMGQQVRAYLEEKDQCQQMKLFS